MRFVSFGWVFVIVLVSVAPISVKALLHTQGQWHDVLHFGAFLAGTILFCWKSRGWRNRATLSSGLFLLAFTVEWLEVVLYGNSFEWQDVALDAAGVIAGWLVAEVRYRWMLRTAPSVSRS